MYKYSFDQKTILDVPIGVGLFSFLTSQVDRGVEVVKSTFTAHDLMSGSVLRLLIRRRGMLSVSVIVGKDLRPEHLKGEFDAFGVYKGDPIAHAWLTTHGLDCDGHNSGHIYAFPDRDSADAFAQNCNDGSDGLQYVVTVDYNNVVVYCESYGKNHSAYITC